MLENRPIRTDEAVLDEIVDLDRHDVIDVGCGTGALSRWMRSRGANVISVECDERSRELAIAADPDHADGYLDGVAERLPLDDAVADVVVFSYSLHHVPAEALDAALDEARRVLRPNGVLYVLEPHPDGREYEAMRPVYDESDDLRRVQHRLEAAGSEGLDEMRAVSYSIESAYRDFEEWEAAIVGVDPNRADLFAEHRERLGERFHTLAAADGDRFVFEQPNTLRVFGHHAGASTS